MMATKSTQVSPKVVTYLFRITVPYRTESTIKKDLPALYTLFGSIPVQSTKSNSDYIFCEKMKSQLI